MRKAHFAILLALVAGILSLVTGKVGCETLAAFTFGDAIAPERTACWVGSHVTVLPLTGTEADFLFWSFMAGGSFVVVFLGGLALALFREERDDMRARPQSLVADLRPESPATAVGEPIVLKETYRVLTSDLNEFRREVLGMGWFIVTSVPESVRYHSVTIGCTVYDAEDAYEWSIGGDMFPGRIDVRA